MGVRLKSKVPWICAWADSFGLIRDPWRRFREISACQIRQSRKWISKSVSTLHKPSKSFHCCSDEMILKCMYGPLGGVAVVDGRWDQLEVNILSFQVHLPDLRAFIVEALTFRRQADLTEAGV
jgi:hypothetical protein